MDGWMLSGEGKSNRSCESSSGGVFLQGGARCAYKGRWLSSTQEEGHHPQIQNPLPIARPIEPGEPRGAASSSRLSFARIFLSFLLPYCSIRAVNSHHESHTTKRNDYCQQKTFWLHYSCRFWSSFYRLKLLKIWHLYFTHFTRAYIIVIHSNRHNLNTFCESFRWFFSK